jgi:hypothetical protein
VILLIFFFLEEMVINWFLASGPPPQVASVAGKKAGMKQGEIGGVLKELGYTSDQVCASLASAEIIFNRSISSQVFKF